MREGKVKSLKGINNKIWYDICTNEDLYCNLQAIIDFSLRFLIRDYNECSVESLIGDITFVKGGKGTRRTRISYQSIHEQMFVRKNGPDPLKSSQFRKEVLDKVFENADAWNFIVSMPLPHVPSRTYNTHMKRANEDTYCFH